MKSWRILFVLSVIMVIAGGSIWAQNSSTAYSKRAEQLKNAYKQKVQSAKGRYEIYRDQVNRAYAEKLRGEWESFTAGYEEEDSLKQKKELEPVVYEKQDSDRTSSEIVADEVATVFLFFFSKAEPVDDILEVKDAGDTEEYVEFTFYGTPVSKAAMENEAPVSFSIEKNQNFNFAAIDFRKIESNYSGGISASVSSNSNLISFYDSYPAFNSSEGSAYQWLYHANTPLSERSKRELYPSIEKFVEGKDTLTALNGILNFLQFGLTYKIDKEVWGGDRVFFAEETLYYPYCDCEDRAILFSRIARDVLHMDVVLVHYPNHLGCAVKIDNNVFIPGDYLIFENNKYLVCDPSYIGAPAGETIPTLKHAQVKIVKLR